jgi:tetratricopeptide (TPR) repeat protein
MLLRLFILAGCAVLAACVQHPAKPPSGHMAESIEANRNGELRFRTGDLDGAAQQYREALRISRSIEDIEGIAANAISLSIVLQRQGKFAEARASLAHLLGKSGLIFPRARLAQAALRQAILDVDQQRNSAASEWLDKASDWCGREGCALSAAISNLRASISIDEGNAAAAAESARLALKLSFAAGNRLEASNAQRLLGNIAVRAGDVRGALEAYNEALVIDRELELPRKIYLDLIGLGRASEKGGDQSAALGFYQRALAVAEADRDHQAVQEARQLMKMPAGGN